MTNNYNPLAMILGGMFAHPAFRSDVISNLNNALVKYGITLNTEQLESAQAMVASFEDEEEGEGLITGIEAVARLCPVWPCDRFKVALAAGARSGNQKPKPGSQSKPKPQPKPPAKPKPGTKPTKKPGKR